MNTQTNVKPEIKAEQQSQQQQPKPRSKNFKPCPQCQKPNHFEARICTCGFWLKTEDFLNASQLPQLKKEKFKKKIKNIIIVSGFVIAFGGAAAYFGGFTDFAAAVRNGEEKASLVGDDNLSDRDISSDNFTAPKGVIEGTVTEVASGDAVTVSDKSGKRYEIRLGGIDAPDAGEDFGAQARENLSNLVLNKSVEVYLQKIENDGRLVGKILLDGENINLVQIKSGAAKHHLYDADEQSQADRQLYAGAETAAKNERAGLWSSFDPALKTDAADQKVENQETTAKNEQGMTQQVLSRNAENEKTIGNASAAAASKTAESKTVEAKSAELKSAELKAVNFPAKNSVSKSIKTAEIGDGRNTVKAALTANARCADGTLSYRTSRSGSCAFHGGVSEWLDNAPTSVKTSKPESPKIAAEPKKTVVSYVLGPRGGCYFINASGARTYVARQMCN